MALQINLKDPIIRGVGSFTPPQKRSEESPEENANAEQEDKQPPAQAESGQPDSCE